MRKIIVATLVILLSVGVFLFKDYFVPKTDTPSIEERALIAITKNTPTLIDGNTPVIEIYSISRHQDGWYIVVIRSIRPIENFVPVKFILFEGAGILRVMDGPNTSFSEDRMLSLNAPDSVILELQKS